MVPMKLGDTVLLPLLSQFDTARLIIEPYPSPPEIDVSLARLPA
jgi:hypothetical protein